MEIRRVLLGKTFLATLAALLLLSSFFFLYQQADARGDYRAYGRIYHESLKSLDDLTWEEGLNQTLDFQKTAREKMKEDSTWKTNLENTHTLRAMEQIQSQYEHLLAYHDYIRQIQKDAKKLQAVSLFSDPESTGYKNTVKTAEDFLSLEHSNLSLGHDLAVTEFFEDQWSDYACVILMLFVCGTLITERKGDLWSLVHATKGGRASLAGKRILILFLAAWIGTVLLVGSKVLLSCWIYHGFGEWDRPIQSISMFYNVPDAMTVGQFWFLYVGVKAMGSFLLGLIFWLLLSSISNLNLAMGAVGLLLAGEYACTTIASSSAFALLRYCNIFSYIQYVRVFIQYLNLPVFGVLISGSDLVLVLVLPLCLIFSVLNISVAVWKYPVTSKGYVMRWLDRVRKKTDHWTCGGSLQIQEAKKLLLRRRGLLVLLLLGLVLIQHPAPERKYDPLNMYFDYFQAKYAGPITEETFSHIMTELSQPQESGRIDALSWMLLEMETAPEGAWLIPSAPYDAIWSDNLENYHRRTALLALLFLVLLLHPIGSQERQSGMDVLHRTASGGRLRLWRRKQVLIFGSALMIWLMVYGAELWKTVQTHGALQCLKAPLNSLPVFFNTGSGWTVGGTLAIYYGLKLLTLITAGQVCGVLSSRCGKNTDALLVCTGVIVIPAALATIGSDAGIYLSLLMPLSGTEIMGQFFPYLLTALIGTGAMLISRKTAVSSS